MFLTTVVLSAVICTTGRYIRKSESDGRALPQISRTCSFAPVEEDAAENFIQCDMVPLRDVELFSSQLPSFFLCLDDEHISIGFLCIIGSTWST